MSYNSKLYICKRIENKDCSMCYNEVLAAINMCIMDSDFPSLFNKKLNGSFLGMDAKYSAYNKLWEYDTEPLTDNYDDELKYTSFDNVLNWCNKYLDSTDEFPYWRIAVLQEMLASFDANFKKLCNEELIVVHYGY